VGLGLLLVLGLGLIVVLGLAFFLLRGGEDTAGDVAGAALPPTPTVITVGEPGVDEAGSEVAPSEPAAILPAPTATLPEPALPTATLPAATPAAGNIENPVVYELLIAKQGEDSLFLVNQSPLPLPLGPLQFMTKDRLVNGDNWEITQLGQWDCISAWKDKGKVEAPDISCNELGRLSVGNRDRFWRESFEIYYGGEQLANCDKDQAQCLVIIPVELATSDNRIDAEEEGGGGDDD
jgi:hypothetical protein